MSDLKEIAKNAESILIAGHVRPDGDCVGSCLSAYLYLKKVFPEKQIEVYMEHLPEVFRFLDEQHQFVSEKIEDKVVDLFIALDSSTTDRLGDVEPLFYRAKSTVCIDHHISNRAYAGENYIEPEASSTCEVLFGLMDETLIDKTIAVPLYIGIIFDSGVFRYSNTSRKTLEIAGKLIDTGIPFWEYIDKCFYERSYTQTQLLGRTLLGSMRVLDGKIIVASITRRMLEFYEAKTEDIDGIVEQMRVTRGVEVAILLHEIDDQRYKVSMRSNDYVDVSRVASFFGGGGHKKAAGCTMQGSVHDVINNLTEHIELQIRS